MRGTFICYIGIDGSGKTTLVNETISFCGKKGKEFKYVWGAHQLYLLGPVVRLGKKYLLGNKDSSKNYNDYLGSVNTVGKNTFLSACYRIALLTEYTIQVYLKIGVSLYFGKNIISDRYLYDTLINMKVNLGMQDTQLFRFMKKLSRYFPKPDRLYFVDVPEEIAFARKADTPSIEYLRIRRPLYQKTAECYGARVIDGSMPKEAVLLQSIAFISEVFH